MEMIIPGNILLLYLKDVEGIDVNNDNNNDNDVVIQCLKDTFGDEIINEFGYQIRVK